MLACLEREIIRIESGEKGGLGMGMQQGKKEFRQRDESRKSVPFQNSPLDFGMPSSVPFSGCK